ncbi:putative major facilitator superfamily-related transporter [Sesbania bispinosa]|nr:putative major facilitator superfamily-related transporter [Sesbania bispinosa]
MTKIPNINALRQAARNLSEEQTPCYLGWYRNKAVSSRNGEARAAGGNGERQTARHERRAGRQGTSAERRGTSGERTLLTAANGDTRV